MTETVTHHFGLAFATLGVDVPDQVKVVGFDNVPESEHLVPSLSTIDTDHAFVAKTAVNMLVERMGAELRPRGA